MYKELNPIKKIIISFIAILAIFLLVFSFLYIFDKEKFNEILNPTPMGLVIINCDKLI